MTGTSAEIKIRPAVPDDAARIAEIEIFNYRLNFYPIFQNDLFYFGELQVPALMQLYLEDRSLLANTFVPYADGVCRKDPWNWEYDVAESGVEAKKKSIAVVAE